MMAREASLGPSSANCISRPRSWEAADVAAAAAISDDGLKPSPESLLLGWEVHDAPPASSPIDAAACSEKSDISEMLHNGTPKFPPMAPRFHLKYYCTVLCGCTGTWRSCIKG